MARELAVAIEIRGLAGEYKFALKHSRLVVAMYETSVLHYLVAIFFLLPQVFLIYILLREVGRTLGAWPGVVGL